MKSKILIMLITLAFVLSIIVAAYLVLNSKKVNNENKILPKYEIVVFLKNQTTEEEIEMVKSKINSIKEFDEIVFVSKEEAKEQLMEKSEVFKSVMENWNDQDNPLNPSFIINTKSIDNIEEIVNMIKEWELVEIVKYVEKN